MIGDETKNKQTNKQTNVRRQCPTIQRRQTKNILRAPQDGIAGRQHRFSQTWLRTCQPRGKALRLQLDREVWRVETIFTFN